MPSNSRTQKRRASSEPEEPSKTKKPRASRKSQLVNEEIDINEEAEKKEERKRGKEAKKEWESSLIPWKTDEEFKWPTGTLVSVGSFSLEEEDSIITAMVQVLNAGFREALRCTYLIHHRSRDYQLAT
ncbi:hypothetical protein D9758_014222 [Tetrapyrgos nigripes]|uniref:Uncharacterized protein n=1 Tax=Tetrapyrgos nigripes TaxID=182062 RepID=A0A8H5FTB8_9AGAR|nr:hypothetical protein D9758_014222 [Tetrapyrgos nigripes]